jgi:hypothetical protein
MDINHLWSVYNYRCSGLADLQELPIMETKSKILVLSLVGILPLVASTPASTFGQDNIICHEVSHNLIKPSFSQDIRDARRIVVVDAYGFYNKLIGLIKNMTFR